MGHMAVVLMVDKDDTFRYGKFLDTIDRRGNGYGFYSSSGSDRYRGRHHYHPYKKSDSGYFPDEFKKEKTPTFDGGNEEVTRCRSMVSWY